MKRTLAIILAMVLLVATFAACGTTGSGSTAANNPSSAGATNSGTSSNQPTGGEPVDKPAVSGVSEETLTIAGENEFSALLPQYAETNPNSRGNNLLWDTLVHYDSATGTVSPGIATAWEWVDDTHIKFTLREGITFSDGSKLTAADVLYSFEQGKNYNLSGYYMVFDTDNFVIDGDYTITFALFNPYPQLLDVLGCTHYAIICKTAIEAAGGMENCTRTPVSSGKYKFVEWVEGQYVKFERNDDYWDKEDLPYYKYIVYNFMDDAASRLMALQSGEAQGLISNTVAQIPTMDADSSIQYVIEQQNNLLAVWFNCSESEVMKDARIREAICLAIDANGFNQVAFGGYAQETDSVFPHSSPLYSSPANNYREVNLERAKELLAEAGYPDGKGLHLSLLCSANSPESTEVLQAQLQQLGIDASVDQYEQATYLTMLRNGEYDINVGMAIYAEIEQFVCDNFVCYPLSNYVRIDSYSASLTGLTYDLRGWPVYSTVRPAA